MPDLSKQLLLYNGYDQVPVVDYTTDTDWQQTELANNASNGDGAESTWVVDVPDGDVPDHRGATGTKYISAHNRLKLFVGSNTIWRGRDSGKGIERGPTRGTRPQEWHVTASDPNAELQGMIVHNWVRGAETDVARFQALVTDYLSGSPRPSTNLNGSTHVSGSNTISMPAKTYTGVTPAEIVAELARASDKDAFVDVDDNLHYHGHDYTGFDSPLRISDDLADLNSTTLLTIEPKTNEEGLDQITVLRSYYGADEVQDSVQVVDNTHRLTTDYWEDVWFDDESVTAAQAADVARKVLDTRRLDQISYTVRVGLPGVIQDGNGTPMTGDYCYMLKAGMRIAFKARAARGGIAANGSRIGDTFQMCHIREVRWTFPGPDQYWADLVLERPIRASRGRGQPAATTPKPPSPGTGDPPGFVDHAVENGENANQLTVGLDVPTGTDQMLLAFTIGQNTATGIIWDSDGNLSGVPTEAFTKLDNWSDITSLGFTQRMSVWYLLNPTPRSDATSFVRATFNGSLANAFGVILLEDVNQTDPFGNYVFAQNTGATASTSVDAEATQTVINFAGWMSTNVTPASPTPDAGQTQIWATNFNNSAGRGDIAHGAGRGDSSPSWSLGSSRDWMIVAVGVNGNGTLGDTTEPVGDPGSADPGTGGTFAPINHIHEHGFLSEDGEHQHDASDIQYDPAASGMEATDLQDAMDELAEDVGLGSSSGGGVVPVQLPAVPPWVVPTGSGQITMAPETRITVDSGSNYKAFPTMVLARGVLHLFYRKATDHITTIDGTLQYRTSDDLGQTWSSATTIHDPTGDVRDPYALYHSSGRIVLTWTESPVSAGTGRTLWTMYSDNLGQSWSTPTEITTHPFGSLPVVGHMAELPNGTIVMGTYGKFSGDTQYSSVAMFSTDRGATFDNPVTIADGEADSRMYGEPVIRLCSNGELVCLLRSDTTDHTYRVTSDDGGLTWSSIVDVLTATGRPDFVEFYPGALAIFLRNDATDFDSRYATSWDYGATWTALAETDTGVTQNQEYAAPVVVAPGLVYTVYSLETSSTDADLYARYFFDGYGTDVLGHLRIDRLTLGGIEIDPAGPADGEVLTYDSGTGKIVLEANAAVVTADQIAAFGFVGPILISDSPSTPLVFADLIQNEAEDDLVYADL